MHRLYLIASLCLLTTQVQAARPASDLLADSGVGGGLVVVVGCEDLELLSDLASREGYLVQGLDMSADCVEETTAVLRDKGLSGRASATRFDGHSLPYVDNLVNLLVIRHSDTSIADAEIQRVLAPGGVAIVDGKRTVKQVPSEIDDWTHHMYDATGIGAGRDTAVSQPRSIQWKAGPTLRSDSGGG